MSESEETQVCQTQAEESVKAVEDTVAQGDASSNGDKEQQSEDVSTEPSDLEKKIIRQVEVMIHA